MRKLAVVVMAALILVSCAAVYAAGGTQLDPLVSRSYLTGTYTQEVLGKAADTINTRTQAIYQGALNELTTTHSANLAQAGGADAVAGQQTPSSSAFSDLRFKKGDVLTLPAGSGALLLAGSAVGGYTAGGGLVDVTAGALLPSGGALTARHRYLAAENTSAALTITSDTAVVSLEGRYSVSPSGEVDYNALAGALKEMGMFQGTGTAYGFGYDLEAAPTRIVGLIMFLRLMGEESAALASTAPNPFGDTPAWCDRYVAYAYEQGYTKGVGASAGGALSFAPNTVLSAGEYMTFVLRALGYTDSGAAPDFTWDTAVAKGQAFGMLNAAEASLLTGGSFLRSKVAYVSYFALSAPMRDGGTLLDHLSDAGALNKALVQQVMNGVTVSRVQ